ncbi:MAG: LysM peptidoglycan-binding domain-containing protein [Firmicutes bacterium]|nr:LysM peptidoglycan-binding domain-containing protein [Bacillota bacterium]
MRGFLDRKKSLIFTLLSIFMLILIIGIYYSSLSYEITVNDKMIGTVKNKEDIEKLIGEIQNKLENKHNKDILLKRQISFNKILATEREITEINKIKAKIEENILPLTKSYCISINDSEFVYLNSKEKANKLLEKVKNEYIKDEKEKIKSIAFLEDVNIKEKVTNIKNIVSLNKAYTYITLGTKNPKEYTIKKGDSLSKISLKYSRSIGEIKRGNPGIDLDTLKIGDKLNLTKAIPLINCKIVKEVKYQEEIAYKVEYKKSNDVYKGEIKTEVSGKKGIKKIRAEKIIINNTLVKSNVLNEEILETPRDEIRLKGTKKRPLTMAYGDFKSPSNGILTSRFGSRWGKQHEGIDIAGEVGAIIKAADGGKVIFSGWRSGYGKLVIIDHENGYKTYYGHCSKLKVKKGQRVYRGQIIALIGTTGNVTGPHVHFEVRKNDVPINPEKFIKRDG